MTPETTYLLIGLGNPGREYRDNRHNFGFMVIDRIIVRLNARGMKVQSKAIVTTATYEERKLILAKPQTYMNESGRAVGEAANFYKLSAPDVIVFYDEIDLAPGRFRMKTGGGAAGHNGIRSMIASSIGDPSSVHRRIIRRP